MVIHKLTSESRQLCSSASWRHYPQHHQNEAHGKDSIEPGTWAAAVPWKNELVNSLAPGGCGCDIISVIFKIYIKGRYPEHFFKIAPKWMPQLWLYWCLINIGLSYSSVSSVSEPMLTQSYVAIWRHKAITKVICRNGKSWYRIGPMQATRALF